MMSFQHVALARVSRYGALLTLAPPNTTGRRTLRQAALLSTGPYGAPRRSLSSSSSSSSSSSGTSSRGDGRAGGDINPTRLPRRGPPPAGLGRGLGSLVTHWEVVGERRAAPAGTAAPATATEAAESRVVQFGSGGLAPLTDGVALGRQGGTVVIATVVPERSRFGDDPDAVSDVSMTPLTVDYREKAYASGQVRARVIVIWSMRYACRERWTAHRAETVPRREWHTTTSCRRSINDRAPDDARNVIRCHRDGRDSPRVMFCLRQPHTRRCVKSASMLACACT